MKKKALRYAADAASRRLKAAGDPGELDRILQEECRRKTSRKLAETLLCHDFRFPTALSAEQCTSDSVAEFHASLIDPGDSVVDLTCGLAIDAFHMARRASRVLAMDIDPVVAAAAGANASALGLDNVSAVCSDCRDWLASYSGGPVFDVAFIDPARRDTDGSRLYSLSRCAPDVVALLPELARVARRLIIKASPMLDVDMTLRELPDVRAIRSVGTRLECKELLVDILFGYRGPAARYADTVDGFSVCLSHGDGGDVTEYASAIVPGDIVAEPWPAVAKMNPRGLLPGEQLHRDTLLWLNPPVVSDFPGRCYRVEAVEVFSSSTLRRLARRGVEASVGVRNFPLSADELRARLKARESATHRMLGVTVSGNLRLLLYVSSM